MNNEGQVYKLKNDIDVKVRPLRVDEFEKSYRFFCNLSESDKIYLRVDVSDPEVIRARLKENPIENVYRIAATYNDQIVGEASLTWPRAGWTSHVGEIRVIILRDFRRIGLATYLYRDLFVEAVKNRLKKIEVQMTPYQVSARSCVEKLGFQEEGILRGFVKDGKENKHDLQIMSVQV